MGSVKYVVVCGCAEVIKPIAYLDISTMGAIVVTRATRGGSQTTFTEVEGDILSPVPAHRIATEGPPLTITRWPDGHHSWTLRCECRIQVQMTAQTLAPVISGIDSGALAEIPTLNLDGHPDDEPEWENRRMIQLGVLCVQLGRNDR